MGDGPPVPTEFLVFRRTQDPPRCLPHFVGVLPSLTDFSKSFDYLKELPYWSPTTSTSKLAGWAFPVSLYFSGNQFSFSSCRYPDVSVLCVYLECAMYSHNRNILLKMLGSPIRRKSLDLFFRTAPQSISVLVPSFIGSKCQGIHRAPLFT